MENVQNLVNVLTPIATQAGYIVTAIMQKSIMDYIKDMVQYFTGITLTGRAIPILTQVVSIGGALFFSLFSGADWKIAVATGIVAGYLANKYYDKKKVQDAQVALNLSKAKE